MPGRRVSTKQVKIEIKMWEDEKKNGNERKKDADCVKRKKKERKKEREGENVAILHPANLAAVEPE